MKPLDGGTLAQLRFTPSDFHVIVPGDAVQCAVSGVRVPLDALHYWNAARQEAYAGAREAFHRACSSGDFG